VAQVKSFRIDQPELPREYYVNPHPFFHEVRAEDPVHWSDQWDSWLLTGYADVARVLRDHKHFSASGKSSRYMRNFDPELRKKLKPLEENFSTGLINSDPPEQTRLRGLVQKAFTPKIMEDMRPEIQQIVDGLLDAVQDQGGMDLIADFAYLLPTTLIARMLGVPESDRGKFNTWTDNINGVHTSRKAVQERFLFAQDNLLEMREYFRQLYEDRVENPQDDLMTRLAQADVDGKSFTENELLASNVTLLTAGYETTISLLSCGMLCLMQNPGQIELLKNNPSLIKGAVEETLRYVSPVQRQLRVVKEDIELGGKQLSKGDLAACMIGAANTDPAQFPEPDTVDITRKDNKHVAFGNGNHLCIGAPLARVEAEVAYMTLLERFPNLRLTGDQLEWQENVLIRRMKSLPVKF
jgi:cytochrome P450